MQTLTYELRTTKRQYNFIKPKHKLMVYSAYFSVVFYYFLMVDSLIQATSVIFLP